MRTSSGAALARFGRARRADGSLSSCDCRGLVAHFHPTLEAHRVAAGPKFGRATRLRQPLLFDGTGKSLLNTCGRIIGRTSAGTRTPAPRAVAFSAADAAALLPPPPPLKHQRSSPRGGSWVPHVGPQYFAFASLGAICGLLSGCIVKLMSVASTFLRRRGWLRPTARRFATGLSVCTLAAVCKVLMATHCHSSPLITPHHHSSPLICMAVRGADARPRRHVDPLPAL